MEDTGAVVASIKSWDGIRMLGVFRDEATALRVCSSSNIDIKSEEFTLDFVVMDKISICQNLLLNETSVHQGLRRVHIYSSESAYPSQPTTPDDGNNSKK